MSVFPDKNKMTEGRIWLPLHMALVLGDMVREDDVHLLYTHDPHAIQRYSSEGTDDIFGAGYLPSHLFCMQKNPSLSLMSYSSMRDMKAFTMSVSHHMSWKGNNNTLQLAVKYSDSLELIKNILQIDQTMTIPTIDQDIDWVVASIGL